jgi:hypothetical protein
MARRDKLLELQRILKELKTAYGLSSQQVRELLQDGRSVPLTLYQNRDLGIMELTVKYLHENESLPLAEIARLINRDQRTVWVMYRQATLKSAARLAPETTDYTIPLVFRDRDSGVLQAIVAYVKERHNLRFADIGRIMNRDPRIICTVYHRRQA